MDELNTLRGAGRIERLKKRLRHLDDRIASSDKDLSYDKAEASALRWAVEILEQLRKEIRGE
jgi:hypothetical protein